MVKYIKRPTWRTRVGNYLSQADTKKEAISLARKLEKSRGKKVSVLPLFSYKAKKPYRFDVVYSR